MKILSIVGTALLVMSCAGHKLCNELQDIKAKSKTVDVLSSHKTLATYAGNKYRICRGLTSMCPKECGHSGEFAEFNIDKYLDYQKPGEYGDDKQGIFQIQISDYNKKPLNSEFAEVLKKLDLKNGDKVKLNWEHVYSKSETVSQPFRPVTYIEKIEQK